MKTFLVKLKNKREISTMTTEVNTQILKNAAELMTNRDSAIEDKFECILNQLMTAALTDDYSLINTKMGATIKGEL